MPYRSRAQQGYMHAAAERGEVPRRVVREMDRETSAEQYRRLPARARKKPKWREIADERGRS